MTAALAAFGRHVARALVHVVPVLFGISLLVFLVVHFIPGDPAVIAAGLESSPEVVERIRTELGLDLPLQQQFWRFLSGAVQGDLGESIRTGRPVAQEIVERFPHTFRIALGGTLLAALLGLLVGVTAAVHHNRLWDNLIMVLTLVAVSTPSYWLALMLMLLFSLELGLLPSIGVGTPLHYVLPILTLGMQSAGLIARMTRSTMLEVLRQEYIRTARAKGLVEVVVVYKHALRNTLIPIVSLIGLRFGGLLAGTVLVESVFAIPGMGRMIVEAVLNRDFPLLQGSVLVVATVFVLTNLLVDLVYGVVDPRLRPA
ncbi:MAG: ABC transporter permease [Vicinamibacterales bacterium]|nr:peptide ABC transporter [Acidobacteriota bacterium]MDP6373683.1 ABC transporter permease [Vicinamibacterales bacterium]MDP6610091.1 ABC transporter permease [Vicinamibacterales bacterium]HAK55468.1 peptide ABC transporter [Acidobacteriota bacterium]